MSERIHTEARFEAGFHYVTPDDFHPISSVINLALSFTKTRKMARLILHEDAPRAWGILTPEESIQVARRLEIDPETRNFTDPELGDTAKKMQKKLGLIG